MDKRYVALALIAFVGLIIAALYATQTGQHPVPPDYQEMCQNDLDTMSEKIDDDMACLPVVQTMECRYDSNFTYQASNSCEASALEELGWEHR